MEKFSQNEAVFATKNESNDFSPGELSENQRDDLRNTLKQLCPEKFLE